MKQTIVSVLLLTISIFAPSEAFAYSIPEFPTCSNPPDVIKAKYDEGTHGIVGETGEFKGSDVVYNLEDGNNLQCFCADNGYGIQTNWWRASSLSQNDIDTLVKLGWIYVPSGAEWGLVSVPYLAKNNEYSCGTDNGSGGEVLSTSTESQSNGTGGQVLAATGENTILFGLLSLGVAFVSASLLLKKRA